MTWVARQDGAWWSVDTDGTLAPLAFDELLASVGEPTPTWPQDHQTRPVAVAGPDDVVEPAWCRIGRVVDGGLLVEGPDGGTGVLDATDLRLLDRLTGPTAAEALARAAELPLEEALRRVGRQAGLGALRTSTSGAEVDPPPEPAVPASSPRAPRVVTGPSGSPRPDGPPGRVPVYAVWHPEVGPLLSLGLLTAAARHHDGGVLNEFYEIRRPETAESFLADLATPTGPAVLLCSDYVWSIRQNLDVARRALALDAQLVVIHGGPSSPKYPEDAEAFLDQHGEVAHVLTRGEGEGVACDLLSALRASLPALDVEALRTLDGITFRDPVSGETVRTPDRARLSELDVLPSPYLTGEFDHIAAESWNTCLSVETNRGCPYGCTFCDWGSSTLSRIRKFDLERVYAELRWAAERDINSINLADANFGIMARDVETARRLAELKHELGAPRIVSFYPAKNTTKHLSRIMDHFVGAGIGTAASISLQSSDPTTLEAIDRANISTDHYVALAADYRRRGLPLQGDLLVGLPGQTYDSFAADLQFNIDHEIMTRVWQVHLLPNAPMNEPGYRQRHGIQVEGDRVVEANTFTRADRQRMLRLRDVEVVAERYGVLRHVLRWAQWDHGLAASTVLDRLLTLLDDEPDRLPHLAVLFRAFERCSSPPVGWVAVYDEVRTLLVEHLGLPPSSAMDCVLELQRALMPQTGRRFPDTISLDHDYVAYYRAAVDPLFTSGHAGTPPAPLSAHGPATFTVDGDPLGLCRSGIRFAQWGRPDEMEGDFAIGANSAYELRSPLMRHLPHVAAAGIPPVYLGPPDEAPVALRH
jgi:hypothetical protein